MPRCPTCDAPLSSTAHVCRLVGVCVDGKYLIEAPLGRGSTSTVYRATQLGLERSVAIKLLGPDASAGTDAVDMLKREARAIARLRHPSVVSIVDFGVAPGVGAYLVTEYLDGCTLRDELHVTSGRFEVVDAVSLLVPVCEALGAAHEAGVVHRDLKPANLFLAQTPDGPSLKVLDFGIATFEGSAPDAAVGGTGDLVGTPLYMSPELCAAEPADARSDVYSLGCVLYEMLVGWPPFPVTTVADALDRHRNREPLRPSFVIPEVPPWLDDVVLRALAKSPSDRFATAGELASALRRDERADPDGTGGPRTNVPADATTFVGRSGEVADVAARLVESRLVTLAGPGGIGKSRLAREVARAERERYTDGVLLVELAGLQAPHLVASRVAEVLGVREETGRPLTVTIGEAVAGKSLLLVLDNCEHLVSACVALVDALLRSTGGLRILATSREVLGVDGEVVWTVPALDEAVMLFVDRARLSKRGFALTAENTADVAELCRRLEGLPLAIELAAARVATLPVRELLARVDDRFRLLQDGGPGALPRHRTLRAALDWSYDHLVDDERVLLARLSVFAGGFPLDAAEAVCAGPPVGELAVFDALRRLADKSLVSSGERVRMLETVRAYAREKLFVGGEEAARLRAHCGWCISLAERSRAETHGPRRGEWNMRLEAEHDNLRAALRWAIHEAADVEASLRLAGGLYRFWMTMGFLSEGRAWLEDALALAGDAMPERRADALFGLANLAFVQADGARADAASEQCVALRRELGDRPGIVEALSIKALIVGRTGRHDLAYEIQEETLALSRELGLVDAINQSVFYLGLLAMYKGDFDRAAAHFAESLNAYRVADNPHKVVVLLHNIGEVAWFRSDPAGAVESLGECLALAEKLGSRRLVADTLRSLGRSLGDLGDLDGARERFARSLAMQREMGNREGVVEVLEGHACVEARHGDGATAVRLAAAAARARADLGMPPDPGFQGELDRRVGAARERLDAPESDAAEAGGRSLSLDEAVALVLLPHPPLT